MPSVNRRMTTRPVYNRIHEAHFGAALESAQSVINATAKKQTTMQGKQHTS
ncbi:hypothetical protein LJC48_06515 [Desulfovibrio sp. OttesenSCG-928-C06]|nr:hypothetical protein [Desulfovibrio sp. OttesenSCG-928-C06]